MMDSTSPFLLLQQFEGNSVLRDNYYEVNGVKLHVVEAGPADGPAIIFLHGFPEFWYGWRKQVDFFVEAGFHVIMPNQRGYSLSSRPQDITSYTVKNLTTDIVSLTTIMKLTEVYLVGHDWGGIVSWMLAINFPAVFKKIVVINAPHPGAVKTGFSIPQLFKSWYVFFFQFNSIPEWLCSRNDYRFLVGSMQKTSVEGTFSDRDINIYKTAWNHHLSPMINWYRAMKYSPEFKENMKSPIIAQPPMLLLWGKKDAFITYKQAIASSKLGSNIKMITYDDATHWVHHEKSDQLNAAILDFFIT